ncbi:hypothetical protein [Flavihumibacter fluvii]|uniref:hypothetical protein n=1 Tax=Flavihumibacter fluvii TaxID=2838157 RepID=UPI001BDDFE4E|nr:hypothetical protein [Flavihumibacter fluvii]ULQ52106.1 hypothetical protein KJS93_18595 [Flavihumibacter fluvii]
MTTSGIKPIFPIEGDVLHARDGIQTAEGLSFTAKISAPAGSGITINGTRAIEEDGIFSAELTFRNYRNTLQIEDRGTGEQLSFPVYWASQFAGKYRLSIDDNIRFMQDIAKHANSYSSIFDNAYLNGLRKLHQQYGTKVHLNLFYMSVEGDFSLSSFPEKFRAEWAEQADWIRLSFHAYQEFPDAPYKNASFETVKKDCDLVMKEIKRIAGDHLTGPVTTIHWGEVNVEGSRALRAAGYKGQLGYFNVDDDLPAVSYYLTVEQRRNMKKRFIWKDEQEDIIFIRSSVVVDRKAKDELVPFLNAYREQGGLPPYVDFLVHEQYYYPDYIAYQPDYFEKLETVVRWANEQGYTPAFLDECIFN